MALSTFTLLIVEDSLADREQYRRYLLGDSSCAYCLLEAESVAAGLELCRTRSIDAILLDYLLPNKNGLDFLSELAVQSNGRMPPVVMMTGQGDESTAVRAIKLGAEDYLVKRDLTPELLQLKVRRAIENAHLRQQQQQQEQRFRASVENMLDCFGIYSAIRDAAGQIVDFRFDYLNAAAMQSNRMTAADIGKTVCEVFPAFRETGLFAEYCQVVKTGIPLVKDDLAYTDVFGGELLTIAYNVQIAKLDDGFMASWRDITAKKQVELSLQAANRQITTILESMTDAYATLDRNWRVVYTNPAATKVYRQTTGLVPAQYLGKSHWEVFPATVGTIVEREYRRAVAERVAVHFELLYQPTETWFEIHAYPSTEGLGLYFRDINQRKRDEMARIAAEQERDRFFNLSIDLLVVANFDGYFVQVNPACEPMLGFTPAEMMAQPFLDFVHPDDLSATAAAAESLNVGNVLVNFENRYRCKNGSYRWILWSAMADVERNLIYADGRDITDRKLQEAQLQQAEATIRQQLAEIETIYQTAPVGLGVIDTNLQFIRVNEQLAQINGLPVAEHIGRNIHEVVPEIADQVEPLYRQVIESGEPILNLEVSGIVPSQPGVERHWLASYHPKKDGEDRVVSINVMVQEITARKHMEAALRQNESQLRLFVRHAPAGVAMFDRDMRYLIASDRWIASYDLPDRDLVGRSHYDIFPDLPQRWRDIHQRCLAGAIESCEEDLFPRVDGSFDWVRWEIHPWYANPNEVGGIIIFSEVITDRKNAEKRLQESEQRLKTGVAVAGVGLARFDYATNLVELSPEAAALYGFAPDTSVITREQLHATFHSDERAELEKVIAQLLDPQGKGWFAQDHRVVWPNGEVRCLSVRKQVFFDRSGEVAHPSYAILAAIDITDRQQNQAALEERNRELDSFVYVVSHDLKAPLRAVANLSQWLEDDLAGQLTADTQLQMTQLRNRVQRMAATIDGLLDYARIGRSEDAMEPVALSRLLADVIDSVAPPPTFTIDLPAELPTLFTKRSPLFQVFVNLVGNGIKHHHSEAGSIQISLEEQGAWYKFAIADDGPGIDPEHQERMFEIFQAVNPQKRSDSTGIGLAIVKKIIEAEGGTIWLKSQLEKGTAFYFTWPKKVTMT